MCQTQHRAKDDRGANVGSWLPRCRAIIAGMAKRGAAVFYALSGEGFASFPILVARPVLGRVVGALLKCPVLDLNSGAHAGCVLFSGSRYCV
jgi:hypothetical protein